MIGAVFGRLTVISEADPEVGGSLRYLCRCTCGHEPTVRGSNLRDGKTTSCGCRRADVARERAIARNRRAA